MIRKALLFVNPFVRRGIIGRGVVGRGGVVGEWRQIGNFRSVQYDIIYVGIFVSLRISKKGNQSKLTNRLPLPKIVRNQPRKN